MRISPPDRLNEWFDITHGFVRNPNGYLLGVSGLMTRAGRDELTLFGPHIFFATGFNFVVAEGVGEHP